MIELVGIGLLCFIFGYITCSTFLLYGSSRTSVRLLKLTHILCLAILVKCIEEFSFAHTYKLKTLIENGVDTIDKLYKEADKEHEGDLRWFKERTIAMIIGAHPTIYEQILEFKDWSSAMTYLNNNKEVLSIFVGDRSGD